MKYALLIYSTEGTEPQPGTADFDKYLQDYMQFTGETKSKKVWHGGEALTPIGTATTVQVRDGKTITTDGPFAETKEQLGGFYILDCQNLDEAIEWAARLPTATHGTIEIRPIQVWEA